MGAARAAHRLVTASRFGSERAPDDGPRRDPGTTLRVVVADDERPARSFLIALLRGSPDVEVVGEAADGAEAVAVIERTRPDLALLDLQMPELDGLGVVRTLERTLRRDGQARTALPLVRVHHGVRRVRGGGRSRCTRWTTC